MSPRGFHEGHQARAITVPERNPDTSATGAGGDSLARPSGDVGLYPGAVMFGSARDEAGLEEGDMARIEGEIDIGRPVEAVFDYVADQSNEPQYNSHMVRAEKVTMGRVGVGTQFRSAVASMGRTAEMLIECTGYDRPRRLASTTSMQQAEISYTLTFEPVGPGTRMRWSGQVRPKGAYRLLGPLITWLGRRQERRTWGSLKHRLEASPATLALKRAESQSAVIGTPKRLSRLDGRDDPEPVLHRRRGI
jgi:uncharacterized protein YndB with AHSA1/START domain